MGLFAIIFSLNSSTQECPNRQCHEYLNYEKIKNLSAKNDPNNNECSIRVQCYTNGLWWVCPNPEDINRSKEVKKSYDLGMFISFVYLNIKKDDFCNDENWNS